MEGKRTDLFGDASIPKSSKPTVPGAGERSHKEDRSFTFDHSFWSTDVSDPHYASQEEVYTKLGVGLLDNAFQGYNACIFAYGQTGSGKTYTMMGPDDDPGLIPRICDEMFARISKNKNTNTTYKVECSYVEIYNERVRDLLSMSDRKVSLKVREHKVLGPYVEGLRSFATKDYAAIDALILEGLKSRVTAATAMNDESSRSHAVFNITLTESTYDAMADNTGEKTSRISLVDLAGSERVWRTGAEGDRLREGGSINKSLSTLGLVIKHLADIASGKKALDAFIPYRDSVLTWLLRENLGGNSKTVMVATVTPSHDCYEETLSTLRYADTAKRITTHAVVNEDANARVIRELREEVEHLRHMLASSGVEGMAVVSDAEMLTLREKLAESERLMKEMSMSWEERLRIAHQVLEERARQLKEMGISVNTGGISVDSSKMYLLNLEPSATGDELTMYYLKDITRIGSAKSQDVQIKGSGVLPEHCFLPVEHGHLYVVPLPGGKVSVNGSQCAGKTKIGHGVTLVIGEGREFRVSCPIGRLEPAEMAEPEAEEGLPTGVSWPGSKFHRACEVGDMATVIYLLGKGVPPNSEDARWKRAPLMLAADHGHIEICKLLIQSHADAGKADERGYTPLHAAADSGHLEICELLVKNGAFPDPQASIGCTPIHRAAEQGHLEVCKFLSREGADINFQDRGNGWTPLLLSALHGRLEVCEYLLRTNADVNVRNRYGETGLHMAAQPGHVELVKLLLQAGADPTAQQAYGRTAFDYASETTSFVMLHSPLERLKKREQVCRMLYPHLTRQQKQERSLTERKAIVIAQVPELADPFKCRMMDYSTPVSSGAKKTGTVKANTSSDQSSRRPSSSNLDKSTASSRAKAGTSSNTSFTGLTKKRVESATAPKRPTSSIGSQNSRSGSTSTRRSIASADSLSKTGGRRPSSSAVDGTQSRSRTSSLRQ